MTVNIRTLLQRLFAPPGKGDSDERILFAIDRRLVWLVALFAIVLLLWCGVIAMTGGTDWDEWQILIAANAVSHGEHLYRDIWDNHGPLLTWFLAAMIRILSPENHDFIYLARGGMYACQLMTVLVTFLLALRFLRGPLICAVLSAFFVVSSPVFPLKGFEIRGDNPMVVFWVLSLFIWFWARRRGDVKLYFLSGLILGGCFFFSVKTLMLGVAAGTMFLADMVMKRRVEWKPLVAFGLGSLMAAILLALLLLARGSLADFLNTYIGQNTDRPRPELDEGYKSLKGFSADWANCVYAALIYSVIQSIRGKAPELIAILAPCGFFLVFQYLFLIPTHHAQSILVAIPVVSILMAWGLIDFLRRIPFEKWATIPKGARVALLLTAIIFASISYVEHLDWWRKDELKTELGYADFLQDIAPREELLFDGIGMPLFNPRPLPYLSLVHTVRERIEAGHLELDFVGALDDQDVPFVIVDERVLQLEPPLMDYVSANYIPLQYMPLTAAGKLLGNPAGSTFEINVPGEYYYYAEEGEPELIIDGVKVSSPFLLEEGDHTAQWDAETHVVICVKAPETWMWIGHMRRHQLEGWYVKDHQ